jgi:Skp family chaperone for outer membrane proteins
MRKLFLATLCATAIGFSATTTASSQSAAAAPAANMTKVTLHSKTGYDAVAKIRKSKIKRSVLIDGMIKKDDSWYRQTPDPCQVEG